MQNAEFDSYAADYETLHARSIRFSGESTAYFAAYKVEAVARALCRAAPRDILDFGGGTGNSLPHFRRLFPQSRVVLADPSSASLEQARRRFPGMAETVTLAGDALPFEASSFDLAFASCVFHHVPAAAHGPLLSDLRRSLRPGGSLFVFEHNPLNPLTLRAVRDCPFDADAVLIGGREMVRRVRAADFAHIRLRYRVFFPHALRGLRPLEPWLGHLPLGGQYFVHARA